MASRSDDGGSLILFLLHFRALIHMIQLHGGGFHVGRGDVRGNHAVTVQVLTGQGFQHGLGLGVELGKAADGQHSVQGTEQVDGTLDDEDDANGHDQRFHGAEGVQDHDNAQHHAEHRQQQKALPAGIAAAAQVQCVLHTTDAVKDHEQAEHDGQDTHHDVAAQDQERTQCQTDDAGDQGELALEQIIIDNADIFENGTDKDFKEFSIPFMCLLMIGFLIASSVQLAQQVTDSLVGGSSKGSFNAKAKAVIIGAAKVLGSIFTAGAVAAVSKVAAGRKIIEKVQNGKAKVASFKNKMNSLRGR